MRNEIVELQTELGQKRKMIQELNAANAANAATSVAQERKDACKKPWHRFFMTLTPVSHPDKTKPEDKTEEKVMKEELFKDLVNLNDYFN